MFYTFTFAPLYEREWCGARLCVLIGKNFPDRQFIVPEYKYSELLVF